MTESAEIWNDAAKSLEFQQNYSGSASCYERAIRFGDDNPRTLVNLAVSNLHLYEFYKDDKYLASAKGYLVSALEKEPDNPRIHHYLGLVYVSLGEKELAADEFFSEGEKQVEESSELLFRFNLNIETLVYESRKQDVYELFPDPALYKVFDLVKSFPFDSALFESLKETYGNRDSSSLLALYLRSIYFKVFDDRKFSQELGLKDEQSKWEALLVFFVRGITAESKALVKSALLPGGSLDVSKLPAYTKLLVGRYRREILSSTYSRQSFEALIDLPMRKLEALDKACEISSDPKGGVRQLVKAMKTLAKVGLARMKGGELSLSPQLVSGQEGAERVQSDLAKGECGRQLFLELNSLLRKKRFEYALDLAKKIRALYEEAEALYYTREIISKIALSEEEKFAILSEA